MSTLSSELTWVPLGWVVDENSQFRIPIPLSYEYFLHLLVVLRRSPNFLYKVKFWVLGGVVID